jgi:hypothetical protein
MNFKKLVLEELINYDSITFKIVGKAWLNDVTGEILQAPSTDVSSTEVYCLEDSKNGTWWLKKITPADRFITTPKDQHYRIIQEPSWFKREKGGYKRVVDRHSLRKKLMYDITPKAVELLHLKQALTPNTAETFGGLIDEL